MSGRAAGALAAVKGADDPLPPDGTPSDFGGAGRSPGVNARVNFLAHGVFSIDRPLVAAGTALPDLLRVLPGRLRIHEERAVAAGGGDGVAGGEGGEGGDDAVGAVATARGDAALRAVARGVLRHLDDDRRFHLSEGFTDASRDVAALLRPLADELPGARPRFIAHLLVEVALDAEIARTDAATLDGYYAALGAVGGARCAAAAESLLGAPAAGLAELFDRFVAARFVADYADDVRLVARLDQVMRRVRQPALGSALVPRVAAARAIVRREAARLHPWFSRSRASLPAEERRPAS